jgi:DNA polymerase III sliding clamp (beta) subunit (PCNA family)
MKRIELSRTEYGFDVAEIDGDTVMFRTYEIANATDYPDMPPGEEFERCGFSMPLDDLRKVVKAADE